MMTPPGTKVNRTVLSSRFSVKPTDNILRARRLFLRTENRELRTAFLRVNSALPNRVRHSIDGQHVSRDTVVHAVGLGIAHYIVEGGAHYVFHMLADG